ncbi:MAG: hypothetical protein NTZ65_02740 [Candidatus Berkelbacteria bacterium]|nr:hypothetical protein [Candidatus Berkelbacteria bacterium]
MKKISIPGSLVFATFAMIFFTTHALAQTTIETNGSSSTITATPLPQSAAGSTNLQAPITAQKEVNIFVIAINKQTQRYLGDVTFELTQDVAVSTQGKQYKIPDPPTAQGLLIEKIKSGSYKILAKRAGYKILEDSITIPSDNQYYETKIQLDPLTGTPNPDNEFNQYIAPYLQQNQGVLAPGNTGQYNGLPNNPNYNPNLPNGGNFPYQNGYNLTSNAYATVPVRIGITPQQTNTTQINSSSLATTVQIIDPANSGQQVVLNDSFNTNAINGGIVNYTILRFGCLQPNHSYVLQVNPYNSNTQAQSYNFQTGQAGTFADIRVTLALNNGQIGVYSTTAPTFNIQQITQADYLPVGCPMNGGATNPGYPNGTTIPGTWPQNGTSPTGQTVFGDPNLNLQNLSNYQVYNNPRDGNYYLINTQNQNDNRLIKFVEGCNGKGGLAFIPAQSGATTTSNYNGNWYVTMYSRDSSGNVSIDLSRLSQIKFSPDEYAQKIEAQVKSNFTGSSSSATATVTSTSPSTASANLERCIDNNGTTFCFYDDQSLALYKSNSLNALIGATSELVKKNVSLTSDKKGQPGFIAVASPDSISSMGVSGAEALTCFAPLDSVLLDKSLSGSGQSAQYCAQIIDKVYPREQRTQFDNTGKSTVFIVLRNNYNLSNSSDKIVFTGSLNHEWAHVYDALSNFKDSSQTISLNNKYFFAKFWNDTYDGALAQFKSSRSGTQIVKSNIFKNQTACGYIDLEVASLFKNYFNSGTDPESSISTDSTIAGNNFVHPSELFATAYETRADNFISNMNSLMSRESVEPYCQSTFSSMINQLNSFFS